VFAALVLWLTTLMHALGVPHSYLTAGVVSAVGGVCVGNPFALAT
jgi:hypothetical protein